MGMNIIPFPQRPEMSLEQLEQTCLGYLAEAKNPIVPVETLLEFCRRLPALAQVSHEIVLDFLRNHEDVEVLDAPSPEEIAGAALLAGAGLIAGERAVLKRRIPTQREMHAIMALQLQEMQATLSDAVAEVEDPARRAEMQRALSRIEQLLQRLGTIMR